MKSQATGLKFPLTRSSSGAFWEGPETEGIRRVVLCQRTLREFFEIPRRTRRIWVTIYRSCPKLPNAVRVGLRYNTEYDVWEWCNQEALPPRWSEFVSEMDCWLNRLFEEVWRAPLPVKRARALWITVYYKT